MAFGNFFLGSPSQTKKVPLFSPEQMQARQSLRTQGLNQIEQNPLSFAPQREQYQKQFNEQIIPTLAERFNGNLSSSAFKGALGNTASNFGSQLAALESQYNLGANKQGLKQLLAGLSPDYQIETIPGTPGILGNIATVGGASLGNLFGGPLGGILGSQVGGGIGGLLQNLNSQNQDEQDPHALLQSLFSSLNLPQSKIQQILNILGAA
jgi:hypothetical protein